MLQETSTRKKSGLALLEALLRYGAEVAARVLGLVRPHLATGDRVPDYLAPLRALRRRVADLLDVLLAFDETIYRERGKLGELRARRDQLTAETRQTVVNLRRLVAAQFVAPRLEELGLGSRTQTAPFAVLDQADEVRQALRRDDLAEVLGEPFLDPAPDLPWPVHWLDSRTEELGRTLDQIDDLACDVDNLVALKGQVLAEYDLAYQTAYRTFKAWCEMAGRPELVPKKCP